MSKILKIVVFIQIKIIVNETEGISRMLVIALSIFLKNSEKMP